MEDLSMPKGREILLDLSETYETISRSRAVQEQGFPTIRKSQSAGSCISRREDIAVNFRSKQHFERKLELQSNIRSTHLSGDIDVCIHSDPGNSCERKQAIADLKLLNSASSTTLLSSEISEISTKPHHNDDAKEQSIHFKISLNRVAWTKVQTQVAFPICLKFSHVRYKGTLLGRSSETNTCILHGVTGSVNPGEFLALMGPSGGGKTTLLNLLGGRIKIEEHSGSITYNNQPYSKLLKGRIGFVHQDDIVFPHLTVRETLTYAARLRLPSTLTKQQKEERAMQVIAELGLERCQDAIIGGAYVRGISGGERKRVCIGNEILLDPSLLFLDEPTSGLDSTTAIRIAQVLQSIAQAGRTVVTTIHQPSSRLFNMFDKLVLLGKGSSLFFGKTSDAMLYFSSIGCSPLIAMNPAEFLVDIANGNMNDISIPLNLKEQESKHQERPPTLVDIHKYLVGAYENRMEQGEMQKLLEPVIDRKWTMQNYCRSEETRIGWWEQHHILFWRGLKERRHDYLSCIRVIQVVSTAVIIGLLWWHSDSSTPKRLQDQAGLLFFISVFWGYFPVFTAIFAFPQERAMLTKERSVDMYKLSAYFIARNMSDIPLELILPIVFLLIVYFMVGLKLVFAVFLQSMLIIFLSIVAAQGLGLAIGAAMMDIKQATTVASVIIMTFMLAGGFFMQKAPSFMTWMRYLSFNYHTYRLLLKTQYGCYAPDCSNFSACKSPFIKELELGKGGVEVGALLAMIFGYRLIAYFFLRRMKLRNTT